MVDMYETNLFNLYFPLKIREKIELVKKMHNPATKMYKTAESGIFRPPKPQYQLLYYNFRFRLSNP